MVRIIMRNLVSVEYEDAPVGLGERLKALREAHDLDFGQLAVKVGVGENAIRRMESGHTKQPSFSVGIRLCHILGVTPDELAFGKVVGGESPSPLADPEESQARFLRLEERVDALTRLVQRSIGADLAIAEAEPEAASPQSRRPKRAVK